MELLTKKEVRLKQRVDPPMQLTPAAACQVQEGARPCRNCPRAYLIYSFAIHERPRGSR